MMNPIDAVDAWKVYFAKRFNLNVDPITILQSQRLIKSMLNRVQEIDKKRAKILKSGKLNPREVATFMGIH